MVLCLAIFNICYCYKSCKWCSVWLYSTFVVAVNRALFGHIQHLLLYKNKRCKWKSVRLYSTFIIVINAVNGALFGYIKHLFLLAFICITAPGLAQVFVVWCQNEDIAVSEVIGPSAQIINKNQQWCITQKYIDFHLIYCLFCKLRSGKNSFHL